MSTPSWNPIVLQAAGSTHSLTLFPGPTTLLLEMLIVKQSIQPIKLTEAGISAEIIQKAWAEQGNDWFELYRHEDGSIFKAARVIWLPNGCLEWNLLHIKNRPYDTLGFTPLTREIWEAARDAEAC